MTNILKKIRIRPRAAPKPAKPTLRSLELAKQCIRLGQLLDRSKCGCELFACSKRGTCVHEARCTDEKGPVLCGNCLDWRPPAGMPQTTPALPINGNWINSPNVWSLFKQMITEELQAYYSRNRGHHSYSGDGIVIVGGGKYFASAYCNIRQVRNLGCTLPIELWYLSRNNEIPEKWQQIVAPYNVQCVDADLTNATIAHPMRILNGWELKFFAVQNSSFNRVLFLDADCFPVRNPTFTFHDPRFLGAGAVFQRDCSAFEFVKHEVLQMFGLPLTKTWDIESGAFLVDKTRWGAALNLTVFLNSYSDLVYKVVYGDKTTPAIASLLANQPYAIPPHPPGNSKWGLMQIWFDGQPLYAHRIHTKPVLEAARVAGEFTTSSQIKKQSRAPLNAEIESYLNDLRKVI